MLALVHILRPIFFKLMELPCMYQGISFISHRLNDRMILAFILQFPHSIVFFIKFVPAPIFDINDTLPMVSACMHFHFSQCRQLHSLLLLLISFLVFDESFILLIRFIIVAWPRRIRLLQAGVTPVIVSILLADSVHHTNIIIVFYIVIVPRIWPAHTKQVTGSFTPTLLVSLINFKHLLLSFVQAFTLVPGIVLMNDIMDVSWKCPKLISWLQSIHIS